MLMPTVLVGHTSHEERRSHATRRGRAWLATLGKMFGEDEEFKGEEQYMNLLTGRSWA
jgi:hypothetical protein